MKILKSIILLIASYSWIIATEASANLRQHQLQKHKDWLGTISSAIDIFQFVKDSNPDTDSDGDSMKNSKVSNQPKTAEISRPLGSAHPFKSPPINTVATKLNKPVEDSTINEASD